MQPDNEPLWDVPTGLNGVRQNISKRLLNVDESYQRDREVSEPLLRRMAGNWQWELCSELIVAQRSDGSYWVIDGNGRRTGALQRADVATLPCRVIQSKGPEIEAKLFRLLNKERRSVHPYYEFRTLVVERDKIAMVIDAMIRARGYEVSKRSAAGKMGAITSFYKCALKDMPATAAAWNLCADICGGEVVPHEMFLGLFELEMHLRRHDLGSLADRGYSGWGKVAVKFTPRQMIGGIYKVKAVYGGGRLALASAQGIINLLNVRRTAHRIPDIIGSQPPRSTSTPEEQGDDAN